MWLLSGFYFVYHSKSDKRSKRSIASRVKQCYNCIVSTQKLLQLTASCSWSDEIVPECLVSSISPHFLCVCVRKQRGEQLGEWQCVCGGQKLKPSDLDSGSPASQLSPSLWHPTQPPAPSRRLPLKAAAQEIERCFQTKTSEERRAKIIIIIKKSRDQLRSLWTDGDGEV